MTDQEEIKQAENASAAAPCTELPPNDAVPDGTSHPTTASDPTTKEDDIPAAAATGDGDAALPSPLKKRKVALFLSYVGHGYQGMQRNPGVKSIEDDLFKAISAAGGISEANSDEKGFIKTRWSRAARTDKGVSAVGQVCSLMMISEPPGIIERINEHLPAQIRAYGYRRVVKGFDARKACDKRRYEYILPVWMFDPAMKGIYQPRRAKNGGGGKEDDDDDDAVEEAVEEGEQNHVQEAVVEPTFTATTTATTTTKIAYGSDSTFEFDQSCIDRLNAILCQFQGTHNFHNYTVKTSATAPQAKRYILSFTCPGVFLVDGQPWVRMVVTGQSFVLHQIRKMVGMAVAEFRGVAPDGCLRHALGSMQHVATPLAPALGLFLDECHYDAYNRQWGEHQEVLQLEDWRAAVDVFKGERLYPALAKMDREEQVNAIWLSSLNDDRRFASWLSKNNKEKEKDGGKRTAKESNDGGGDGGGEVGGEGDGGAKRVKREQGKEGAGGDVVQASFDAEYSD